MRSIKTKAMLMKKKSVSEEAKRNLLLRYYKIPKLPETHFRGNTIDVSQVLVEMISECA
jgi:hypothetical protein